MNVPKPHPPVKKVEAAEPAKAVVKKPFVPKEHLTSSPFRENEGMRALQKELNTRRPRRGAVKTQEKK